VPTPTVGRSAGRLRHSVRRRQSHQREVDAGRRRFLDHLLVAALQRAVAAAQPQRVAVAVGQHLDLDMARMPRNFSM
jgi:hypothetical protein